MKTTTTKAFLVFMIFAGCNWANDATNSMDNVGAGPYIGGPGVLVMADRTNATDILFLTISVDDLIRKKVTEWPYLRGGRTIERRKDHAGYIARSAQGRAQSMCADGGGSGYVLSLAPSPSGDVAGSNIEFNIRYSGSFAGNRKEGNARVVVPVGGTTSGRVDHLTYISEWRPNNGTEPIR